MQNQLDLSTYRCHIDALLEAHLKEFEGSSPETALQEAISYSVRNGGKRFRPIIVYLVAEGIGGAACQSVDHAALAIEYFHTASLIADDLPCMDDEILRRDKPALHRVYGEATALLASYALIAAGYDQIRIAAEKQVCPIRKGTLALLALECASINMGLKGAIGGQFEDLHPPSSLTSERLLEILDKKTATLFEISFVFGWLFGQGELVRLESVKKMARAFGRAFQLSDDLIDFRKNPQEKSYPALVGEEKTLELLREELHLYQELLEELKLATPSLMGLLQAVEMRGLSQQSLYTR